MQLKTDGAKSKVKSKKGIDEEFTPIVNAVLKKQGVKKQQTYGANIKLGGPAGKNRK